MKVKNTIYLVLGLITAFLGALGAFLPILPTVPFLLAAAFCFSKSSERLHTWFISTKLYKNNLESYSQGKGMTVKTKVKIMVTVTIMMAIGFILMKQVVIGRIVLAIVWIFHVIYFTLGVKTLRE